jgi:hypothetical protein
MERDEKGVLKWVHTKHLYRDWGSIKACLIAFTIAPAIAFVFFTVVCGFADGFSLSLLSTQGKIWGLVFLIFMALLLPSYYLWAWANGGVDEWEFEMDDYGIEGRKVVRKAWRMKLLRGIACILMILPSRGNQKMAMRSLFYDSRKQKVDVSFSSVKGVSGNEKNGLISLYTRGDTKEIHVPREDYAEVLAFIEEILQKKKAKRAKRPKKRTVQKTRRMTITIQTMILIARDPEEDLHRAEAKAER